MTYSWRHYSCPRFSEILKSWESTPYSPNQRLRGQGADCIQLVAGILDDLFQMKTDLPFVPQNTGLHDRRRAIKSIHAMMSGWYSADVVVDESFEPGDILVTRSSPRIEGVILPKNPGHVMMVTDNPFEVMQSVQNLGAYRTGLEHSKEILRTYRPRRKDLWSLQK